MSNGHKAMSRRLNWELSLAIIGLASNLINLTFIIVIVWHGFTIGQPGDWCHIEIKSLMELLK